MVIIWLMMVNNNDWLVVYLPTPLKNDWVQVSWDDDIPNIWKNKTICQPILNYVANIFRWSSDKQKEVI